MKTELQPSLVRQTLITVPYNGDYFRFFHPGEGPDTYQNVFSNLAKRRLSIPTGEQTAFLLDVVYNSQLSQEPEAQETKRVISSDYVWVAEKLLWVPESKGYKGSAGVYVVYDENGTGISVSPKIRDLEESLEDSVEIEGVRFSKDMKVAFAPRDTYKGGKQTSEDFAKNGFIRASYGVEGAKKLADFSKTFLNIPRVVIVDNYTNPELRVSTFGGFSGDRLYALGNCFDDGDGHAFGVLR